MPNFTHAELIALWHGISQMIDSHDNEAHEAALSARGKLDDYILSSYGLPQNTDPNG